MPPVTVNLGAKNFSTIILSIITNNNFRYNFIIILLSDKQNDGGI
jgi:hypothetical protein